MIECGITFDLAQLVIDNEYAKMIKHAIGGIPVNDESLAVDVIHEIGIGKDFLSHESTYNQMRSISYSSLIDRSMREDWESKGSKDIYEKAKEKVKSIIESHKPEPLSGAAVETLREIVEEAETELNLTKT
jgi:trimethylamine--corrinoid protein Co-methyltransferase